MRYASIDIGTNTLRLLIAETGAEEGHFGGLKEILYKRAITRLGGGYTEEKGISADAAERTLRALESFRDAIDEAGGVERVYAVATSVVRRARNRDRFIAEASKRAGIEIEVITGDEEAKLSLAGVLSVISTGAERRLVMDIGGGSTEFIATTGAEISGAWSMEMGVVHLSEEFLRSDPPEGAELEEMERGISGVVSDLRRRMRAGGVDPDSYCGQDAEFIGTAGTITTLAAIDLDLDVYDKARINNHRLSRSRVQELYGRLKRMTLAERAEVLSLEKGREDLIIPGTAIVLEAMDAFGFEVLTVSDAGLLEGAILRMAREK